jgi:glycosyltransferase involved in cell wall biosynthesis
MEAPKISVIIPTFNRAHYLGEAIDSVLVQTVPVHEIIVIDDGSMDETPNLMAVYGDRVRYLRQKNQGPSAARNYGMREAAGSWIAFLDSDDLWVPEKIQVQTEFIHKHPDLEFIFGNLSIFDKNRNEEKPEVLDKNVQKYLIAHADDLKDCLRQLLICNPIPTSSVLFRRDCQKRLGFLDETMRYCEDYEYWLRFATGSRMGFIDHILVRRRMHESNAVKNYASIYEGALKVLKRLRQKEGLPADTHQLVLLRIVSIQYDLSSRLFKSGRFDEAYLGLAGLQACDLQGLTLLRTKIWVKMLLAKMMTNGIKATDWRLHLV